MERRTTPGKILLENRQDKLPVITGYAAVYYDGTPGTEFQLWENTVERILPGSFDSALARKDDARALFNHDPNLVLGRVSSGTLRLSADSKGLKYEIVPPVTRTAEDLVAMIQRGDVTGSSFEFLVT